MHWHDWLVKMPRNRRGDGGLLLQCIILHAIFKLLSLAYRCKHVGKAACHSLSYHLHTSGLHMSAFILLYYCYLISNSKLVVSVRGLDHQ